MVAYTLAVAACLLTHPYRQTQSHKPQKSSANAHGRARPLAGLPLAQRQGDGAPPLRAGAARRVHERHGLPLGVPQAGAGVPGGAGDVPRAGPPPAARAARRCIALCGIGCGGAGGLSSHILAPMCVWIVGCRNPNHISPIHSNANATTEAEGYPAALETAAAQIQERGFDLIEQLVQPPVDQFLK